VNSHGRVKILDFGLAKMMTSSESETRDAQSITEAGSVLGTVSYMSPEQVKGEALDHQTDIFSFGCVLFEAATGRLPFVGPNLAAIMYQIATVHQAVPSSLRAELPPELDSIISRALAKNKEDRYSSALEAANDLQRLGLIPTQRFAVLDSTAPIPDSSAQHQKADTLVVGREPELQRLEEALLLSRNGKGKIVFVTGEAGIGKTCLVNRFLETTHAKYSDLLIASGQCVQHYGTGEAFLPFLDAIGSLLSSRIREHMISVLRQHAPTWYFQFPAYFDSSGSMERLQKENIGVTRERMLREFCDAFQVLSGSHPIVLLLEDLHWADASTVDLLRYVSSRLDHSRLLLLGTFRDKDVETKNHPLKTCTLELRTHKVSQEIALHTLLARDIKTYLDISFSPNQFSSDLAPLIYRKTEGHALFVTSLVQFLVDQAIINKEDEMWVLSRPLSEMNLEVPENVRSMIRKKIEGLNDEEKQVLQFASVAGVEFLSNILAALLTKDEITVEEGLNNISLVHGMIRQIGEEELPDHSLAIRYRFAHVLYQNVLYEDIITKRRTLLHRQTAELLLSHYSNQAGRIATQLALHFKLGRDQAKAFEYFHVANLEATSLYQNALQQLEEHLQRYPEQETQWNSATAEVHEKLGDVLALSGMQKRAREEYGSAVSKFSGLNRPAETRIHRKTAKAWETERSMEEAAKEYDLAEQIFSEQVETATPEQWQEWIELQLDRSWLHYTRNELAGLETVSQRLRPLMERYGTPVQHSRFFQNYLYLSYRKFRYQMNEETVQYANAALQAAEESKDPGQIASMTFANSFCRLWRGDLDLACEKLLDALHQAEKIGNAVLQSRCITYLTVAYRKKENLEKVREYIPQCFELCSSIKMDEYVAAAHANLAWLSLREGKKEEARTNAKAAIRLWRSLPLVSPFQGLALWPLIAIAQEEKELTAAIEYLQLLLHPSQHQLSAGLTAAIENTIRLSEEKRWEESWRELARTLEQAHLENHL